MATDDPCVGSCAVSKSYCELLCTYVSTLATDVIIQIDYHMVEDAFCLRPKDDSKHINTVAFDTPSTKKHVSADNVETDSMRIICNTIAGCVQPIVLEVRGGNQLCSGQKSGAGYVIHESSKVFV
ncbi:hypothetical protein GJ496_004748 [Pomphorhynchus laevis]|nr:hypothetical protein GJ496_004748 [Pomphorhynchus laevis]